MLHRTVTIKFVFLIAFTNLLILSSEGLLNGPSISLYGIRLILQGKSPIRLISLSASEELEKMCQKLLANTVIEDYKIEIT